MRSASPHGFFANSLILPAIDDGNGITEAAAFVISPNVSAGQKFVRLRVTLSP